MCLRLILMFESTGSEYCHHKYTPSIWKEVSKFELYQSTGWALGFSQPSTQKKPHNPKHLVKSEAEVVSQNKDRSPNNSKRTYHQLGTFHDI